jgi:hypothetical protein
MTCAWSASLPGATYLPSTGAPTTESRPTSPRPSRQTSDAPARTPAAITVYVDHGVVTLHGTLTYRSRAEHAGYAASRVAGVVAIRNNLSYELDDLMITGL